ncbi:TonB-dependent receptor [Neptunicella sp. SCSIO 80796]|uniref:TonB-dependent receptor n=1 Tax=Neptunicella plasticusilytica TaxID=3117012 RepID=UPI003A4DAEB3
MKTTRQQTNKGLDTMFKRTKTSLFVLSALGMLVPTLGYAADEPNKEDEELEIIKVSGLRSSIISAQEKKLNSNKIMDGISADDMGALPDRSITETLQRVAGVAIDRYMTQGDPEHFSVEGNGVIVRGLSQVRSELNGRSSFSATGGRSLSFGDVPPELLSAVNVYKSPSADQIEGGLAGTIDLVTRLPFQEDGQKMAFTLSANHGDLIEETKPAYSLLYSNNWDTSIGKIGFLADIAYSELSTRNDSIYVRPFFYRDDIAGHEGETVYVPRGADWRTMHFNRERTGNYVALQWAPADNHELTLTYFNSNYDMQWDEDAIFVGNDPYTVQATADSKFGDDNVLYQGRLYQDGGIPMGSDVRVAVQESETTDITLGYRYYNDKLEFTASVQNVDSESSGLDSTVATEILVPYLDVDFSGSVPEVGSDADYLATPGNYNWNFQQDSQYLKKGDMTAVQADVKYFLDSKMFPTLKVGGRYSDSTSDNADTGYNWAVLATSWAQGAISPETQANITPAESDLHLNTFDNFFGGQVSSPANVYAPIVDFALNHPTSYETLRDRFEYTEDWIAPWQLRSLDDENYQNNQTEKTYSAYFMLDYELDTKLPISGNFGVRYVKTENTAHGHLSYPNNSLFGGPQFIAQDAEHSYSNVLPSLNVRIELSEDVLLRLAVAKTMARPDFSTLGANLNLSANIKEGDCQDAQENGEEVGTDCFLLTAASDTNPYRDPMEATQFDASLEWYYDEGGSMYFALFSKDVDGYESTQLRTENYGGFDYNVSRPVSTGEADMKGFEISINHFFKTLPEPFDGLGIQANYTYIDSSTSVEEDAEPFDADGSTYGPMPYLGLSKNAYNLVGIYEKGPISFRLAYNWRSEFLMSTRANGYKADDNSWALPVFNAPAGYLDGSIAYKINDNLTLALEANNLGDTVTKNIMKQNGPGNHYGAYHASDRRYALSLRGNF